MTETDIVERFVAGGEEVGDLAGDMMREDNVAWAVAIESVQETIRAHIQHQAERIAELEKQPRRILSYTGLKEAAK